MKKKIFIMVGFCIILSGIAFASPKYIAAKGISSVMEKFAQELRAEIEVNFKAKK